MPYFSPYQPSNRNLRPIELFWNRTCRFCGIPLLTGETSGFCCGPNGQYRDSVPPLPPLPAEFNYFVNHPNISRLSRKLNNIFSFSALQSDAAFPQTSNGFVAVQGRIYHQIRPNHRLSGARWVLYDGYQRDAAPPHEWLDGIPVEWTSAVATALLRVNPLSRTLSVLSPALPRFPHASIAIHDRGPAAEIAALIRFDNSTPADLAPRSLVIVPQSLNAKVSIPAVSRLWEPLSYPLLFPHGSLGWGVPGVEAGGLDPIVGEDDVEGMTRQLWFYRRRLLSEERFALFGRLTNEYLVDMFSRNLETRLHYIRENQLRLRREDALLMGDLEGEVPPMHNVLLPASFVGSQRWAGEQVADTLAIAAEDGPPTFFITMTCNPNWPEIQECLLPGQTYADAPLVVARVFAQKLSLLLAKLPDVFPGAGAKKYVIRVVEFQKRGLPHAHILIKFAADCTTPQDIDAAVSAELPDDPADRALVEEFMIHSHGPYCQRVGPNGEPYCRFKYSKPVTPETWIDDEGRVHYRRRNARDCDVVPHVLLLLRMFRCHINVEVANAAQIFQYMFKYIHKGPDRAHFAVVGENDPIDEIADYWSGRYLSATEAAWRILGKHITSKIPAVSALPIHLEDSNTFRQYHRRDGSESQLSALDRYFRRPRGYFLSDDGVYRPFSELKYSEYYKLFRLQAHRGEDLGAQLGRFLEERWEDDRPSWQKMVIQRRAERRHITRLMGVRPSQGETFYLRALLQNRPASSFLDLRTIDGEVHPTFQHAAIALGLFEDQREAQAAMMEAVQMLSTPRQLRFLFVDLLVNDCCHAPLELWELFNDEMSHDFYIQNGMSRILALEMTLQDISHWLETRGHSLDEYGLPAPRNYTGEVLVEIQRWCAHPDFLARRAAEAVARFNPEQHAIFGEIVDAVVAQRPLCMFIDGRAGRGKTFVLNAVCDWVRSQINIVLPTATSAFAAQLYPGGRTAHSLFKIPVNEGSENLESPILPGQGRARLLQEAKLFIWDEAPMANRAALACVDELLRRLGNPELPFGGRIVVLVGDFRQTCPVIRRGTRVQVVDASIRSSPLWSVFQVRRLIRPIRNAADPEYANFVDNIGNGAGPTVPITPFIQTTSLSEDLIDWVFPPHVLRDPETAVRRSVLAPTNTQIDEYNSAIQRRVQTVSKTFLAADSLKEVDNIDNRALPEDASAAILDYVSRHNPPGLPHYSLTLKVGCIYRLLRNLAPERGCVKNVRGVVESVGSRIIGIRLMRPENGLRLDPEVTLLPRIPLETSLSSGHTLVRHQFPLGPAYSTTFNGCQGLTLDRVGVDLTRPVFSHGQLYTALSRARTRDDIRVRLLPGETETTNVTYPEILLPE